MSTEGQAIQVDRQAKNEFEIARKYGVVNTDLKNTEHTTDNGINVQLDSTTGRSSIKVMLPPGGTIVIDSDIKVGATNKDIVTTRPGNFFSYFQGHNWTNFGVDLLFRGLAGEPLFMGKIENKSGTQAIPVTLSVPGENVTAIDLNKIPENSMIAHRKAFVGSVGAKGQKHTAIGISPRYWFNTWSGDRGLKETLTGNNIVLIRTKGALKISELEHGAPGDDHVQIRPREFVSSSWNTGRELGWKWGDFFGSNGLWWMELNQRKQGKGLVLYSEDDQYEDKPRPIKKKMSPHLK